MSKKSDDSIERIFRQALTQYDTTFREDDWLKMEKMLNEEANRRAAARSKRIRGTAYTLTGLTGLIIAVYFLAFKNPSSSIAKLNDSSIELQATDDLRRSEEMKKEEDSAGPLSVPVVGDSSANQVENSTGSTKEDASKLDDVLTSASKPSTERPQDEKGTVAKESKSNGVGKIASEASKSRDALAGPSTLTTAVAKNQRNKQQQLIETSRSESVNAGEQHVAGSDTANQDRNFESQDSGEENVQRKDGDFVKGQTGAGPFDGAAVINESQNDIDTTQATSKGVRTMSDDLSKNQDSTGALATTASESIKKDTLQGKELTNAIEQIDSTKVSDLFTQSDERIKPSFRWSVGVIFSPEFSTTSLGSYSAPGASLGLRIGYQVSSRFSINTGLIRSNKKYIGKGSDYSPRNPAYWQIRTNGVIPEEIDSRCLVYELPIGLQYDAVQTQKSRLFLSAAISSYFMISQAYDYTFDAPNPGADSGWRSSGSESYWFNIGVVSAGYERFINRSFALGIEPYLKVSLAEIGWPNIKLFSAGAYVTLRYRFHERKDIE
jgi:hypothetical protein